MKRYALPLIDQGVVAAFNLALQLALVRFASAEDYGTFVLWQALLMVMVGFQDAMIGLPLSVRVAYDPANRRRYVLERQVAAFAALFVAVGAVIMLLGVSLANGAVSWLAPAQALFAATFLAYYAVRFLAQSRAKFGAALAMDTVYSVLALATVAALVLTGRLTLLPLFLFLSAPAAIAAASGLALLDRPPAVRLRRTLKGYAAIWRDSRWTVVAVAASELQNRAFVFTISILYGPAVLAGIFAGNLILRHLVMLVLAWKAFARPFVAAMRESGDMKGFVRFCAVSAVALVGLYVVNLLVVTLAWPLIETYIYAGKYENMLPVVRVWTLINALQVPVVVLALMLTTLGRYRDDSLAVITGALVTVSAVVLLALFVGPQATLFGAGLGYIFTATLMGRRVLKEFARRRQAGASSSASAT
ncbi:hypothetical protein ATO13_14370 [Stappia sp. 22II-S9-Z10]|nr:hypothetical protein ATO13_14370 [Stappia sp. 22II-S9-Z10]